MANLKHGTIIDGGLVEKSGTVSSSSSAFSGTVGTAVVFESAATSTAYNSEIDIVYDANTKKVVIVYEDWGNSQYGTAVVGTVSGTTITYGTPVVFSPGTTLAPQISYDTNAKKVVIAYRQDVSPFSWGKAIVGTVSGTSISFGIPVVFQSDAIDDPSITYDADKEMHVISYRNGGNSNYGTAIVGTVSGTSIGFGTSAVYDNNGGYNNNTYDANAKKVVIVFRDLNNSNYGTAIVGTIGGGSLPTISFGTKTVFNAVNSSYVPDVTYDANAQKVVAIWADQQNDGMAIVGTVSGTSISFGTAAEFTGSIISDWSVAYDASAQKVVMVYQDQSYSDHTTATPGTISGTSISFGTHIRSSASNRPDITATTYVPNAHKIVSVFKDRNNSNYGTGIVFQLAGSNITISIDLATGNFFELDFQSLTGNITTFTISSPHVSQVSTFKLQLTQASASVNFNWDALSAFKWPGGIGPDLTTTDNAVDIYSFTTWDTGSSWYGRVVSQNLSFRGL